MLKHMTEIGMLLFALTCLTLEYIDKSNDLYAIVKRMLKCKVGLLFSQLLSPI